MEMRKLKSRKFRKPSDGDRENVDRLSSLPDDILIHILSFLTTKIYVKTSILGRRWRFLWARVPNLDLDDRVLRDAGVSSILFLHKRQTINIFRFYHSESAECSDYVFEKWIITAIECNVQELDLSLSFFQMLPLCIFTCKTLVVLSVSYCDVPTGSVFLPSLKKLQLDWVDVSDESLAHLLSGCPVLDELFIKKESGDNKICISSPTINRLDLEIDYDEMLYSDDKRKFKLKLDTPALEHLKFNNYVPKDDSKVTRLAFFAPAETFHSLTDLELFEANWRFIPRFLEKTDFLEVLTIRISCFGVGKTNWIDPKQVPACLVSHLRTVRIHCFECKEQKFNVVRYILRNAKVLRRMEIFIGGIRNKPDIKENFEAIKKISLFERGSETCQVAFH